MWPLSRDDARRLIPKMDTVLIPFFTKCVRPICAEKDGAPVQCGTGTLFKVADTPFLVTASHVADVMAKLGHGLYLTDTPQGSQSVPLEGKLNSERNLDIAIWELTPRVVKGLPNCRFLTVQHADRFRLRVGEGLYYVHGYPNCWSETKSKELEISVKQFTYGTGLYKGPTDTFDRYDPEIHLLLSVSPVNVDLDGNVAEMPQSLSGISGCSLWQVYYPGCPIDNWQVDDAVIVAVQTGTYRNGTVVKGTYWGIVDEMIKKAYPNLASALNLVVPHRRVIRR